MHTRTNGCVPCKRSTIRLPRNLVLSKEWSRICSTSLLGSRNEIWDFLENVAQFTYYPSPNSQWVWHLVREYFLEITSDFLSRSRTRLCLIFDAAYCLIIARSFNKVGLIISFRYVSIYSSTIFFGGFSSSTNDWSSLIISLLFWSISKKVEYDNKERWNSELDLLTKGSPISKAYTQEGAIHDLEWIRATFAPIFGIIIYFTRGNIEEQQHKQELES